MEAFLVSDNRIFNGPLGRLLRSFVRTAHSAHLLRSAPQRSAALPSLYLLIHFAHTLVRQLKFMNMCSRYDRVSREETRFLFSLETRPMCCLVSLTCFLTQRSTRQIRFEILTTFSLLKAWVQILAQCVRKYAKRRQVVIISQPFMLFIVQDPLFKGISRHSNFQI